jgi:integrase
VTWYRHAAWVEQASLPISELGDPRVIRAALDGLCTRLDGSPAAANTVARKRAVFHGALGYAVELGLLPANPAGLVRWRAPKAASAVSPATVPSPAQVGVILAEVARIRPELAAFFGCLYYAALRPEEAVALRRDDLILPTRGRGTILTAACPRTGSAWTSTGTPFEPRGLKHRPDGTIRVVPIPPRPGPHAPPAPACVRDRAGRAAVPRHPRRHAQRIGLRSRLARRPPGRPRPGPGRHRTRPPPL